MFVVFQLASLFVLPKLLPKYLLIFRGFPILHVNNVGKSVISNISFLQNLEFMNLSCKYLIKITKTSLKVLGSLIRSEFSGCKDASVGCIYGSNSLYDCIIGRGLYTLFVGLQISNKCLQMNLMELHFISRLTLLDFSFY